MISNNLLHQIRRTSIRSTGVASTAFRGYISKAHPPESTPVHSVGDALTQVLEGVEERKVFRQQRWETSSEKRVKKEIKDDGPYRNQDETIELALNLNLDPRKPGQAIRGSLSLPNGTGKKVSVVVFASDDETESIESIKAAGASHVGGTALIESIQSGDVAVTFDRALATPDMMPQLSKIARILGPRGLMPNAKLNTIQSVENMPGAVKAQSAGMVQYRTDKNGIVHAGVGKGSFSSEQLSENIREFMTEIQSVKPESFGKGKKGKGTSKAEFYLKAHLTASQGKGSVKVDLGTLDPTSKDFMQAASE